MNKRLIDIIDITNGLFKHMDLNNPMWTVDNRYKSSDMDIEFLMKYGQRLPSPLLKYFKDDIQGLSNLIYSKYKESWEQKYKVLSVTYDILNNYDMVESENVDRDTLENTLIDVLRSNNTTNETLNNLAEALTQNRTDSLSRTGFDTISDSVSKTKNDDIDNTITDNTSINETDTLSFSVDRADTETRQLTKEGNQNITVKDDGTDIKSFLNRKDVNTVAGTTGEIGKESMARTETGKDILVGSEGTIGTNTDKTDTKTFGFGDTTATPTEIIDNNKSNNQTITTNNTTDRTNTIGDVTDIKKDVTESKTDTREQLGTETITKDITNVTTGSDSEVDSGTITTGKTGSETNTRDNTSIKNYSDKTLATITESETHSITDTKGTTDTSTISDSITKNNTGTVTDTGTETGNSKETGNMTGTMNETRTLTRKGNIGVTTTQDILKQHVEFWEYSFLDDVYKNVVEMISLSIF